MGCTSSKLDDLPAVALCRDRCSFLDEAIRERYALSQAHIAYLHSLKGVGRSLQAFLDHDFGDFGVSASPPSPKKSDQVEKIENQAKSPQHSHSDSGSHLDFNSSDEEDEDEDEDEDDSDSHLFLHSDHGSPLHNHGYVHMNYMRNKAMPSVVYEQKPMSPETVRMGDSSSSFYQYPYPSNDVTPYPYYGYPSYGGGYYGSSSPPPPQQQLSASSSKPPPPPPSPPRASAWDFLNFFEGYETHYPPTTPSRDSKELREEEGIPDLEEEDFHHEVVKEVHGDQKFVDGNSKAKAVEEVERRNEEGESSMQNARPSSSVESEEVEYEVHVVDKKVVEDEGNNESRGKPRDASEVVKEIEFQFEKASESGNILAKILEAGRLPPNRKHVTSKMLHVVSPSLSVVSSQPSTSRSAESSSADHGGPAYLEVDEDLAMRAKNLSAVLQKLYLWEKKLYNEVKAEEKMRVEYDRKRKKLKRLDERGAEPHKVDSTRTLMRSLSTKIRMAIHVVDRISGTINKIRDDELWPQLLDLIKGLTEMYRCMLECHRTQCQAIRDARSLGPSGSGKKLSADHLEATLHLEHELINWTSRFSTWISAQKGYVRALNNWLLKSLLYEPEETADGVAPFSPGRIGAPPIFVICNQWSQALDGLSEKEVIDSMRVFANGVLQLWEQDKVEMQQRMQANRELERRVRFLEREDQKIHKEIQALDKNLILASGDNYSLSVPVYQSDASSNSMQASLLRIFEAMESFTAESTKTYEELLQRSEEESARMRG